MEVYKSVIRPAVELFDSERGHHVARSVLHGCEQVPYAGEIINIVGRGERRFSDPRLAVDFRGIRFDNPVMVGAGWDKNAEAVAALYSLGFSGVEIGTVLPWAQSGNPKPRQFRIGPGVSLNRLGFNSPGMTVVAKNLERYKGLGIPIGGSVGKNKEVPDKFAPAIHAEVTRKILPLVDYIAINVSSPNTPGLRRLQGKDALRDNMQAVNEVMDQFETRKPRVVKVAADLSLREIDDVIEVVKDEKFDGVIVGNTTINELIKSKYGNSWGGSFAGGLAGDDPDYRKMSNDIIRHINQTDKDIYLIGVGGVKDGPTALEKIQAGAHLVQMVTAIWSEGPFVAHDTNKWIADFITKSGVRDINDLRGIAA